jgi:hypothetical protein
LRRRSTISCPGRTPSRSAGSERAPSCSGTTRPSSPPAQHRR